MQLTTYCFSPTGTSRKNMMAVVKGLNPDEATHNDYTYYNINQGVDSDIFFIVKKSILYYKYDEISRNMLGFKFKSLNF